MTKDSCAIWVKWSVLHHVAIPGGGDGLRCNFHVPASELGWCRRYGGGCSSGGTQHEPSLHALLVRTGGSVCPVQTEPQSSSRARACCSLYYILLYLLALEHRHHSSSAILVAVTCLIAFGYTDIGQCLGALGKCLNVAHCWYGLCFEGHHLQVFQNEVLRKYLELRSGISEQLQGFNPRSLGCDTV
jgi:hypothetical protein